VSRILPTLALFIIAAPPARAQRAVSGTCRTQQGDPLPDCVCSNTCPSSGGGSGAAAPTGAGLTPAQQVFVNGMGQIWGQMLQSAMQPRPAPAAPAGPTVEQQQAQYQQRLLERRRQQEAERRQQEAERAAAERRERDEIADHLNGQLKMDSGAGPELSLKHDDPANPPKGPTNSKNPALALDCAMADVYEAAASLGAGGKRFANRLRLQVLHAKREMSTNPSDRSSNTCDIVDFSRNSMDDGIQGPSQLVVSARSTHVRETGQTVVNVLYTLSNGKEKAREGQDVIVLNSSGGVDCQQATPAAARCVARFDTKSASTDYCPRPAPEQIPRYPACGSAPAGDATVVGGVPLK